jgi:7-cyano-7-deazaguanine synthase in queuosine biosynthesis
MEQQKSGVQHKSDLEKPQVVLFTGGRDSTLTASMLMMRRIPVCLLSADSGASLHRSVTHYRVDELRRKFGTELLLDHVTLDVSGTFRSIALQNIETDILTDKKNLVVVGESLAILAHTVNFCLRNKYDTVNCGYTKYQEEFPEQRDSSIVFSKEFLQKYNIKLECPIYEEAKTIEYVKYRLLEIGLSNKPLEGSTLFSDTFSVADNSTILNYMKRKESLTHEHIDFLTQNIFTRELECV